MMLKVIVQMLGSVRVQLHEDDKVKEVRLPQGVNGEIALYLFDRCQPNPLAGVINVGGVKSSGVPRSNLITNFWSSYNLCDIDKKIAELENAIEEAFGFRPQEPGLLRYSFTQGEFYLNLPVQVDAYQFHHQYQQALTTDVELEWREAVNLYSGDFLPHIRSDWAKYRRKDLKLKAADAFRRLAAFTIGDEREELEQRAFELNPQLKTY
jgi:hypothetical protein